VIRGQVEQLAFCVPGRWQKFSELKISSAGVTEGCEVQVGAGEKAVGEAGPVLHPFERGFDQRSELATLRLEVGQGPLEV
jgi:hypothetical protein